MARRDILDAGYSLDIEDARVRAEVLRVTRDAKVAYYESILADGWSFDRVSSAASFVDSSVARDRVCAA